MATQPEANGKEQVDNFLLTTTFHGLHKVAASRSNSSRRHIWLIIVILHVLGFSGHLSWLVSRYLSYPVITKQNQAVIQARFPDVTVCFNAQFRGSKVDNNVTGLGEQKFKNAEHNARLFWQDALRRKFHNLDQTSMKNILHRLQINSMMKYAVNDNIIQDLTGQLIVCWLNERQKCSANVEFVSLIHPQKGSCITYSSVVESKRASNHSLSDNIYKLDLLFGQIPQDLEYDFDYTISFSKFVKGLTVILHSPNSYPIGIEHINNILFATTIDVKMTSIVQDNNPMNPCLTDIPLLEVWQPYERSVRRYAYNSILCNELQLQRDIKSYCQCVSEGLPLPNEDEFKHNVSFCHQLGEDILGLDRLKLMNNSLLIRIKNNAEYESVDNYTQSAEIIEKMLCHERVINRMTSNENCLITCSRTEYDSSSFYEERPFFPDVVLKIIPKLIREKIKDQEALNKATETLDELIPRPPEFNSHFQRVGIRLSSLLGDLMTQKSAYSLGSLFSDIGGIFGLWIGCSIITILELSEFSFSIAKSKRKIRIASHAEQSGRNAAISLEATRTNQESMDKSAPDDQTA